MEKVECTHPWGTCENGFDICGVCGEKVGGNGKEELSDTLAFD